MEAAKPVSMEALFEQKASHAMVSEANAFRTVPRGMYVLRPTKYEATEDQQIAGRVNINFSLDVCGDDGTRKAKAFLRVSPQEGRSAKGYLDTKSKLYGQLVKALFGENQDVSAGEVVQTFMQQPVKGFVALQFKAPQNDPVTGKGIYVDPKSDEEEADCRKKGYTPSNVIRSVQKL
jgi:hypothetical protein